MANASTHPFYPPDIDPVGYAVNTLSIHALLGAFAVATAAIISFTSAVLKGIRPTISRQDKVLVGWFVFSNH